MKLNPAPMMAFVIEDTAESIGKFDSAKKIGLVIPDAMNNRLSSSTGVIYAIDKNKAGFKVGERVIYSRFTAERVDLESDEIPPNRLRSIPIDSLLGWIL